MSFEITILGTSSATPTTDRHPSAQYLNLNTHHILIDCGEGTQIQMMRYGIKSFRIGMIFISHLHPDHYLGLPGLLSTLSLKGREEPLHIFAPDGMKQMLDVQLQYGSLHLSFPLHYYTLPESGEEEIIFDDSCCEISCFPLEHRLPCWGFLFREKKAPFKIRKEALAEQPLPTPAFAHLKKGQDYTAEDGTIYKAADFIQANTPPLSYAYITDTLYLPQLAEKLKSREVNTLYHESTYLHELEHKAVETHHSTARQAAEFARTAGVQKLIIGHFSSRYKDLRPLLEEARSIFPETYLAEEGKCFQAE